MAKLKLKKYPKKPKASASLAVKERFLQRCKDIDKENKQRHAANKRSVELSKKISQMVQPRFNR